jgi:hypothetical protein
VALQFCSLSMAQTESDSKSLKGLSAVSVAVDPIDPDIEREGLSRSQIQREVEMRLKAGGIKVLAPTESPAMPGQPQLCISVNAMKGSSSIYSYSLEVSLQQRVLLDRDPQISVVGSTWATGSIGIVGAAKLGGLFAKITDLVGDFLEAWRSANPRI